MVSSGPSTSVRPSAIAGTWYPGSATALRRTVEAYLERAKKVDLPGRVLALVSPHAGYAYSGGIAANAFAQVRDSAFSRVVLLGPLHRPLWGVRMGAFMVPSEQTYRTPLGDVAIDHPFVTELGKRVEVTAVHGDQEHSLEIELPFLQVVLGAFELVPIMLGEHITDWGAPARLDALSRALAEMCDEATLVVASTDLSHMDNYADVVRNDRRLVELVSAFDVDGLSDALREGQVQACGATGLVTALRSAEMRGAGGATVLSYAASGDVTGDKRPGVYTVGYMAAAVHL